MKLAVLILVFFVHLINSQTTPLGPDTEPIITTLDPITDLTTAEEISSTVLLPTTSAPAPACTINGMFCSDPNTFSICFNNAIVFTSPCPTSSPYCNNDVCSNIPPPTTTIPTTVPPTTFPPATTPAPTAACTQNGMYCSDPYSVSLCFENEIIITNKCPPSSPYCNKNVCSKIPTNPTDAIPFRCTSEGYFPDPSNCNQYKFCPSAGALASQIQSFSCPKDYIFDVTQLRCVLGWLFSYRCQLVICDEKNRNKFIEYKPSKGYYAYCSIDGEVTMFKCADSVGTVFNPKTLQCEYKCPWEGYFKNQSDCTKYYFCHWVGLQLQSNLLDCPVGYYFNGTRCLKGSCK